MLIKVTLFLLVWCSGCSAHLDLWQQRATEARLTEQQKQIEGLINQTNVLTAWSEKVQQLIANGQKQQAATPPVKE